jgi:hypothetical protein
MIRRSAAIAAVSLFVLTAASADMGRIYVERHGVTVSEHSQKAIILHNDRREVLILGTEWEARGAPRVPVVRFIPFPAEPTVSLAPRDVFTKLGALTAKYRLEYVTVWQSKGGAPRTEQSGVEVRLATRLGQHDMTVIKVNDVRAFRAWVNRYFASHHLPRHASYAREEAIVADYVRRGIVYFALDAVELGSTRFVDPVTYEFDSPSLYYPLLTSNAVGGSGAIELFLLTPHTLCKPGMDGFRGVSDAAGGDGRCLGLDLNPVHASNSAAIVAQEHDLESVFPAAGAFFGARPVFFQAVRYEGPYHFDSDVMVTMPSGVAQALRNPNEEIDNAGIAQRLQPGGDIPAICRRPPDPGVCKAAFERFYFNPNTGACYSAIWGGCDGNPGFETIAACRQTCVRQPAP